MTQTVALWPKDTAATVAVTRSSSRDWGLADAARWLTNPPHPGCSLREDGGVAWLRSEHQWRLSANRGGVGGGGDWFFFLYI